LYMLLHTHHLTYCDPLCVPSSLFCQMSVIHDGRCGPCQQFTPELVRFYEKMNKRRGQRDKFEIVWISRCRDLNSHNQYFTHMPWLALPPEEAMGPRGQQLSDKYRVKGIPTLVLVDDLGQTITTDARNKIPQDKAGIGFPWRNPLSRLYATFVPRSLRMMVKLQVDSIRTGIVQKAKGLVGMGGKQPSTVMN
jgi:nucleoredoxin